MADDDESGAADKRHEERHRTFKGGRVVLSHSSTIDCVIRNMSEEGVLIEMSDSVPLPARFELLVVESNMIGNVELRWQRGRQAGLHLLGELRPSVRKFTP